MKATNPILVVKTIQAQWKMVTIEGIFHLRARFGTVNKILRKIHTKTIYTQILISADMFIFLYLFTQSSLLSRCQLIPCKIQSSLLKVILGFLAQPFGKQMRYCNGKANGEIVWHFDVFWGSGSICAYISA